MKTTWNVLEEIEELLKENTIFEELSFDGETVNAESENDENPTLELFGWGKIDHPMSGYSDMFNEAKIKSFTGTINKDGNITATIEYKMIVGPAIYVDEIDELKRVYSSAKTGEIETSTYTTKDAEDFVEWLEGIPQ